MTTTLVKLIRRKCVKSSIARRNLGADSYPIENLTPRQPFELEICTGFGIGIETTRKSDYLDK